MSMRCPRAIDTHPIRLLFNFFKFFECQVSLFSKFGRIFPSDVSNSMKTNHFLLQTLSVLSSDFISQIFRFYRSGKLVESDFKSYHVFCNFHSIRMHEKGISVLVLIKSETMESVSRFLRLDDRF